MVSMRWLVPAVLAASSVAASAGEAERPCRTEPSGTIVCGTEAAAIRVIRSTNSPTGRFAIGWRAADPAKAFVETDEDDGAQTLTEGEAETLLVDLTNGSVLSRLAGTHFGDNPDINHARTRAMWSPDERFVVEAASGKWSIEVLTLTVIEPEGERPAASKPLDLLPHVRAAAHGLLKAKRRHANPDDYVLDTAADDLPAIDREGRLALPVIQQIPKTDIVEEALVTLQFAGTVASPVASVVSAMPVDLPD